MHSSPDQRSNENQENNIVHETRGRLGKLGLFVFGVAAAVGFVKAGQLVHTNTENQLEKMTAEKPMTLEESLVDLRHSITKEIAKNPANPTKAEQKQIDQEFAAAIDALSHPEARRE